MGSLLKLTSFMVVPSANTVAVRPPGGPAGVAEATPLPMIVAIAARPVPNRSSRRGALDVVAFISNLPCILRCRDPDVRVPIHGWRRDARFALPVPLMDRSRTSPPEHGHRVRRGARRSLAAIRHQIGRGPP